jgi:hypothetical protein
MKMISILKRLAVLLVVAVLVGPGAVRLPAAADTGADLNLLYLRSVQAAGMPLTGLYQGVVELNGVYNGTYQQSEIIRAFDGGQIDLALVLEQVEEQVDGYIDLDLTMVFNQVNVYDELPYGPYVSGSFSGTILTLESEQFDWQINPGRVLDDGRVLPEEIATRQFRLVATEVQEGGARLVGEYRETIWGIGVQPITLVGDFALTRPVFSEPTVTTRLYLPVLAR